MQKQIISLILSASLLSGCSLSASQSTTSATQPTPLTTAQDILTSSANAMLKLDSYEYTLKTVSNFGDSEIISNSAAVMFPAAGDAMTTNEEAGFSNTTYLKNNIMYMQDPGTGNWVFLSMPPEDRNAITIDAAVNSYMEAQETEDGYVVSSLRPLNTLEFYTITGTAEKEMNNIQAMADQGVTMETMAELWLDKDFRYIKVIYDQVTTSSGVSTGTTYEYQYSKYNGAEPVVVPEEILTKAKEFDPTGNSGEPDAP